MCCGEKRNRSAASTDADHCHQQSAINLWQSAIINQRSQPSGAVPKTHGKKQPNRHQPSLYKTIKREDRYSSGSHCSGTSLCVSLSLLLWAPLPNDEIRTDSTNTSCCLVSPHTHRHGIGSCCWPSQKIQPLKDGRDAPTRFTVDCTMW